MTSDGNKYFECECHSFQHTMKLYYDSEDGYLSFTTYINSYKPWYKRVWLATKYVFGMKLDHSHFDEFLMKPEDSLRFYNIAKHFKEYHQDKQEQ